MAISDRDRPDDSNEPRHKPDSLREEASAAGQRLKGAAKEMAGDIADDPDLEGKASVKTLLGKIASARTTVCKNQRRGSA